VLGVNDLSPLTVPAQATRYELRFTDLSTGRCEYAFQCNKTGLVDIDELTDRRRTDYFYARSMVGKKFSAPVTASVIVDSQDNKAAAKDRHCHDQRELAS
jgi:hypothetical protein